MQGLARLGGPCHLTGSGMGLAWELVDKVAWATGNVVEDMQLGIDFLLAGHPPQFVPEATVLSELPASDGGVMSQRRRWEHGFLQTVLTQVPQMLGAAFQQTSWPLLLLALDLCVPPLALLTLALAGGWLVALGLWMIGLAALPLVFLSLAGFAFFSTTLLGWSIHCRDLAPVSLLLEIPRYVFAKVPLYLDFCAVASSNGCALSGSGFAIASAHHACVLAAVHPTKRGFLSTCVLAWTPAKTQARCGVP